MIDFQEEITNALIDPRSTERNKDIIKILSKEIVNCLGSGYSAITNDCVPYRLNPKGKRFNIVVNKGGKVVGIADVSLAASGIQKNTYNNVESLVSKFLCVCDTNISKLAVRIVVDKDPANSSLISDTWVIPFREGCKVAKANSCLFVVDGEDFSESNINELPVSGDCKNYLRTSTIMSSLYKFVEEIKGKEE